MKIEIKSEKGAGTEIKESSKLEDLEKKRKAS